MYPGITVIKRNGRREHLDISKIRKYTMAACERLKDVDYSELELDAKLQFRDGITTEEIQETLIKTAVDKIDIDRPNWNYVAARLFLYDLYHRVTGFTGYNHLKDYFKKGEEAGRILPGLKEKFDLDDLNEYLDYDRDLQFTYLGIKTLYDRYIIKDKKGNPIELPQQLFMGVAMFLAQNETNPESISSEDKEKIDLNDPKSIRGYWAKNFYDVISKFEVMVATPTLSNARTTRHQLSSCFLKGTPVRSIDKEIEIDKIKEGDFVLTHNKEFKKVTETYVREYNGELIKLNINGLLRDIKATVEHPVLSIKSEDVKCDRKLATCLKNQGNSQYCYKLEGQYKNDCDKLNKDLTKEIKWNEIKDLKEGDFVSISFSQYIHDKEEILISDIVNFKNLIFDEKYLFFKRNNCSFINDRGFINNQVKKVKNRIKLNKDFFLLIGYYLAEGHISKDKDSLIFTFSSKETYFINEVKSLIYSIFEVDSMIKENSDNSTNVIVNSKIVASFIYELAGSGFNKKRLSPILTYAKPDNQIEMLIGVIRGDGCAIEEGYQLTLSNKELIEDLFEISLRCGLSPYMFKGYKNSIANYYPYYLKIGSKNDKEFVLKVNKNLEKINFNQKGNSKLRYFWLNDKYFMRIDSIEKEEINELVYNIEVEDDHSYSVNFVDVHNCYVGSMNDNIEGIFDDYKEMALLSKFGGGIGWDVSKIRALGSFIDNHKNAAGGVVPWLKIANDVAIAVDQLGTRKGAIAVYLEPWHMDILDFLDLKKNSGEERRRAHDLFPALWISDLFMKRAQRDELWTLFDPYDVPDLTDLYGEEFEKKYVEYENDDSIPKRKIKAKELWKKVLLEYYETGNPFLCFKDNANKRNQNSHSGIIRSSNLCTEIFQNTEPNHYKVKVTFEDESVLFFEENEEVEVKSGGVRIIKKAKKITSLDSIEGKQVYITEKVAVSGKTAVCNLASVNLSKVNTPEKIKKVIPVAIRMLDNVIDLNFYPVRKTKDTNIKNRAIGLGAMGEAQMLAERQIFWGSEEHFKLIDEIFEGISFMAIDTSCNLAKEKGIYPEFKGSRWEKGILPIDTANENAKKLVVRDLFSATQYDWEALRKKVKKGIRNGYLMAIAPTSSISILTGTTQTIEPVYKRKWYEENLSGLIPVVVPNLSAETYMFYTPAYELDQTVLVKAAAIRQKWVDQGQSLNIFITTDKASGKYLNEIYTLGWKLGIKSFYYLRSQSPEVKEDVMDRSVECFGCQ